MNSNWSSNMFPLLEQWEGVIGLLRNVLEEKIIQNWYSHKFSYLQLNLNYKLRKIGISIIF